MPRRRRGGKTDGRWVATGVSIDTRTLEPGDLFVALTGESRDGHEFVADALKKGAAAALVSRQPPGVAADAPLLMVSDTQAGLEGLGRAARARSKARIVAVTGSAGKTTTKEMLRLILARSGSVACLGRLVQQSLGRAALARAHAARHRLRRVRDRHEPCGRNPRAREVRPSRMWRSSPRSRRRISNISARVEAIADAKAEIFEGIEPGGAAILPLENPQFDRLLWHAKESKVSSILTFGKAPAADARLLSSNTEADGQRVLATIGKMRLAFAVSAAGGHIAMNGIAALLAARELGADVARGADELANFAALKGRGARFAAGGIEVIDESYNANPASMAAAIELLSKAAPQRGGRRIAVLGDMRELGRLARRCTRRFLAIWRRRVPIWCSCAAPTCARCGTRCPRRHAVTMRRRHRSSRRR